MEVRAQSPSRQSASAASIVTAVIEPRWPSRHFPYRHSEAFCGGDSASDRTERPAVAALVVVGGVGGVHGGSGYRRRTVDKRQTRSSSLTCLFILGEHQSWEANP